MTPDLDALRDLIQEDVGRRGLRTDPGSNLVSAFPGDFVDACRGIASTADAALAVVTGFLIPHAHPPCGETDGPLGALFLARALVPLGVRVVLVTDPFCTRALEIGLAHAGLRKQVPLVTLPTYQQAAAMTPSEYVTEFKERAGRLTHLIALERVGPSHTPESIRGQPGSTEADADRFRADVPPEHHNRCHTMRGRDITALMSPAERLFDARGITTIGIGDGGNEMGMGKLPWDVIRRNIPGGGPVACRVPCDHLIVCGVSNWGAYALAAGVRLLRGASPDPELFDPAREQELLRVLVEEGPLVDGVTADPTVSVDGLPFERYGEVLRRLGKMA